MILHQLSEKFNLHHQSQGDENDRLKNLVIIKTNLTPKPFEEKKKEEEEEKKKEEEEEKKKEEEEEKKKEEEEEVN